MIAAVDRIRGDLDDLCREFGVSRLDLFGSAARQDDENKVNDYDFLVEFLPGALQAYADNYFGLLHALEKLLGKPVDLVDLVVASAITNPYFLESVQATRELVYEA